jgi:hypothetical protein
LFGYNDDFGAVDSGLDVGGGEGWKEVGFVEIASSARRYDVQADDEDCVKALKIGSALDTLCAREG